jgi:hypothetical protein
MTPTDVIREMRKFVADRSLNERTTFLGGVVKEWADALEQAMREPVAEVYASSDSVYGEHGTEIHCLPDVPYLPPGTKLYTLPPTCPHIVTGTEGTSYCDLAESAVRERDAEIERLQACFRQLLNEAETVMAAYGTTNLAAVLSARFIADLARTALAKEDKP